jgi:thiosulfate dehydrogenase (quinone) large subunit
MRWPKTAQQHNSLALAVLRIAVGCLFIIFAEYKVFGAQFTLHGGFSWWINQFLQSGTTYPFVIPLLQRFVLPNAVPFAFLVAYCEFLIGIALLLGICVRAASAFGMIYMLSLLFSSNFPGAHAPLWQYFGASLDHSVLALCFLTFIIGRSDECLRCEDFALSAFSGNRDLSSWSSSACVSPLNSLPQDRPLASGKGIRSVLR